MCVYLSIFVYGICNCTHIIYVITNNVLIYRYIKSCVLRLSIRNSHHFEACSSFSRNRVLERCETEAERWACSWIANLADFNCCDVAQGCMHLS